ncbi:uncharacterized protein LOC120177719 [Hibiscus syriacus]|uniref:uncharacterized protein LOC120177719 n=1 Tax=Hibiscus syriacus TaxID=106335 RepID=UPI001925042F|nr:uncharacterized protein LOC120177719 [Hibiscus syriacus]
MAEDLIGLQKQMEELTTLVKQGKVESNPPKWWETQENRISALESRMATNHGYITEILKILTGRKEDQNQSEEDQVQTPDSSNMSSKQPVMVTVINDKTRFTYKQDEPGILKSKPNDLSAHIISFKNDNQIGENNAVKNNTMGLDVDGRGTRVCDKAFADIVEEFTKLVQKGSVEEYQDRFEELHPHMLLKNPTLGEEFFVSLFINGLRDDIKHRVKALDPKTLSEAYRQAKLYELSVEFESKILWPIFRNPSYSNSLPNSKPNQLPIPQKSSTTLQPKQNLLEYRRKNNLCFMCGEKFVPGHQCKIKQLNMMIEDEIVLPSDVVPTDSEQPVLQEEESLEISMNAITGCIGYNTLRIQGSIQGKPLNILIDSGSTHIFLTPQWAEAGIQVNTPYSLAIKVANGQQLYSSARCNKVEWQRQGHSFVHDFRLLQLGGSDMVLGQPSQFLHQISEASLLKMTALDSVILGHVVLLSMTEGSKPIPAAIQPLLEKYKTIFEEPKGLPPERNHDHGIPLKPDSILVNLRPYRFPHNQKAEVERQIATMLSFSIIQPSRSLFVSPCLLIKKKDGSWRFCVDYRQLNNMTIKDKFPIPVVEDLLDELHGAVYFSKIDLRSGSMAAHIAHLQKVLEVLQTNQLFAKFSKCFFGQNQVEYLGHIISAAGFATDPTKVEAMKNSSLPKSLKSLRGFLGLTGYYRRFIKDYVAISKPLTQMLKTDNFQWTSATVTAFEELKRAMSSALVLALSDFSKNICLETDASSGGIGAVLSQNGRPIAYLSKALSPRNSSLSIYEREYLAILLKLTTTIQKKDLTKLLGLDYTIQYRKGRSNVVVDALSRQWEDQGQSFAMSTTIIIPSWVQDVEASYKEDLLAADWISKLTVNPTIDINGDIQRASLDLRIKFILELLEP